MRGEARPVEKLSRAILFKENPKLRRYLRYNRSKLILDEIYYAVKRKTNIVIDIFGLPGTGKSEIAQSLAFYWKKAQKEIWDKDVNIHFSFSFAKTVELLMNETQYGDIIVQDESTRLSGSESKTSEAALANLLDLVRATQISFIFVSPNQKSLSVCNLRLESWLQDYDSRANTVIVYDRRDKVLGHAVIRLHNNEDLRKQYLDKKMENIDRIIKQMGRDSVTLDPEKLKRDVETVINTAESLKKEYNIDLDLTKKDDVSIAFAFSGVAGSTRYEKKVVKLVVNIMKKRGETESTRSSSETSQELGVFDGDRFKALRNVFRRFWERKKVNIRYARILTSYYLWSRKIRKSNSKKYLKPDDMTAIDDLPLSEVYVDWSDEITSAQSLYQSKSDLKKQYLGMEKKITTHDLEAIGEQYAKLVLEGSLQKHLNPPLVAGGGVVVGCQVRDGFVGKGGKPHDVAVFVSGLSDSVVAVNHKLFTSGKRVGKNQLGKQFGSSGHPFAVLWFTWTRPFRERFFLRVQGSLLEGAQGQGQGREWLELEWEDLLEKITERILQAHAQARAPDQSPPLAREESRRGKPGGGGKRPKRKRTGGEQ